MNGGGDFSATNPFASNCVRPGAIAYRYPPGQSAASLISRLVDCQWRGQIVGPHGTGKSSLLVELLPELTRRGVTVVNWSFRGGIWRDSTSSSAEPGGKTVLVIDGFEQLSGWRRAWTKLATRCRAWGLLVTAHRDVGLPPLVRAEVSADVAWSVVRELQHAGVASTAMTSPVIDRSDVEQTLAEAGGNLRDALFALYDLYESRRR